MSQNKWHAQSLSMIKGSEMSSVEFVRNYVQLRFDGPTLTTFTMPVVTLGDRQYGKGSCGYRDALCSFIGKEVTDVAIAEGDAIRVFFKDGAMLEVSLREEDSPGPEAAMFHDGDKVYEVWQV